MSSARDTKENCYTVGFLRGFVELCVRFQIDGTKTE